jgi:hypothetical protein
MDTNTWKWFYLDQLFSIDTGKDLIYSELSPGEYPVIGHKAENNGVTTTTQYLATHKLYDYTKTISLADRGNFYASVQTHDFYVGTRVKALVAKFEAKIETLLYICVLINKEQYRFSYGRNCCDRISEFKIKLPVTPDGTPDWKYMEDFVKDQIIPQLPKKAQKVWLQKYDTAPQKQEQMKLNTEEWKWFKYTDLFRISGSKTTPIDELENYGNGVFPYVTTQAVNNGVEGYYNYSTEKGGVLTVDSAVLGFCSYQENDFSASDHVEVLTPLFEMNRYIAIFLVTLINKEQYRYSYGRKCSQIKLRNSKIKLPATPSGEPDWQFMEDYIKSLPYSKNLEPSDPNEVVDELVEMKKEMIKMRQAMEAQQHKDIHYHIDQYNDNSTTYNIKK